VKKHGLRTEFPPFGTKAHLMMLRLLSAGVLLIGAARQVSATVITVDLVFPFSVSEGSAFSGIIATFGDDNPAASPSDFNASIDWGDGTSLTAGAVNNDSGLFSVSGTHTYADEGTFTVTMTINDNPPGTGTATATCTATVSEGDTLSGSPAIFSPPPGSPFTGTVANFSDTLTSATVADFTATINWGDGTPVTTGTVSGGGGSFHVSGTHTYAGPGTFSVVVTLSDDAPGTAMAQVTSTAAVALTVVPTLNEPGMLIFALLIATAGLMLVRKR
jgi:hypothetical protein